LLDQIGSGIAALKPSTGAAALPAYRHPSPIILFFVRLVAGDPRLQGKDEASVLSGCGLLAVLSYLNAVKPLSLG
jgi:hypothetical protein